MGAPTEGLATILTLETLLLRIVSHALWKGWTRGGFTTFILAVFNKNPLLFTEGYVRVQNLSMPFIAQGFTFYGNFFMEI